MSQFAAHVIHRTRLSHPPWLDDLGQIPTAVIADVHDPSFIIDPSVRTFTPDIPLYGPALTVNCPYGDNLMLHKAVSIVKPGDVIVLSMEPGDVDAVPRSLAGEVLAYGALQRGASGMVLDALIRDVDAIGALNFPVYARGVCIRGPDKKTLGTINHDVYVGGVRISPGDVIIGDRDGLVSVPVEQGEAVLARSQERLKREVRWKQEIKDGRSSLEILGFDSKLAELGIKEEAQE